jgi:hypothetical protein
MGGPTLHDTNMTRHDTVGHDTLIVSCRAVLPRRASSSAHTRHDAGLNVSCWRVSAVTGTTRKKVKEDKSESRCKNQEIHWQESLKFLNPSHTNQIHHIHTNQIHIHHLTMNRSGGNAASRSPRREGGLRRVMGRWEPGTQCGEAIRRLG